MSSPALPVIAHCYGAAFSARIREVHPRAEIRELPARAWEVPLDGATVLLAGPGRTWSGAPTDMPADWSGLDWVQVPGAGINTYPAWLCAVPRLTTGQGINSLPVAEFVLASLLAHEKRFPRSWVRSREEWQTLAFGTLEGKTLGLAGFGGIGEKVAQLALAFGMRVRVLRRSSQPLPSGVERAADLLDLVTKADHLVIALPSLPETRRLFDEALLRAMKPSAHLVNVSRGDVIDQDALLRALDDNRLAAASLDVTDPEPLPPGHALYTHPKVRLTPHSAFSSPNTQDALLKRFLENLARYIRGEVMIAEQRSV